VQVSSLYTKPTSSSAARPKVEEQSSPLKRAFVSANANVHAHLNVPLILCGVAALAFVGGTLTSVWWLRTSMSPL